MKGILCCDFEKKQEFEPLQVSSEYVTIVTTVPETHAEIVRDAMGRAGAGSV